MTIIITVSRYIDDKQTRITNIATDTYDQKQYLGAITYLSVYTMIVYYIRTVSRRVVLQRRTMPRQLRSTVPVSAWIPRRSLSIRSVRHLPTVSVSLRVVCVCVCVCGWNLHNLVTVIQYICNAPPNKAG